MSAIKNLLHFFTRGWVLTVVSVLGVLAVRELENEWFTMPFTLTVFFVVASLLFLASRRIAFSIFSAWSFLAVIGLASLAKYREQGFGLHAYDIVFAATDTSLHGFLLENYGHLVLPVIVLLGVCIAGLGLLAMVETPRPVPLAARLLTLAGFTGLLPLTIPEPALGERHEYLLAGRHVSAFFVSILDFASQSNTDALGQRLAALPGTQPMPDTVACSAAENLPDVVVVLSETQTPPSNFPQLQLPSNADDSFLAHDDSLYALGVETFGGGTWITTVSLMTGLSAADFGWKRPYLTSSLKDRVRGALPDVMARCGYHTAAILPMDYHFVNEGPFLHSIGFETILDVNDIGVSDDHPRDSVYYGAAKELMAQHRAKDDRPLFLMVQTLFPHGPYNTRIEPEITIAGEPFSADEKINEYIRRIFMARSDLDTFLTALQDGSPDRGTVVLEFGDHQAGITRQFVEQLEGSGALSDWNSLAYQTHFTTHAFEYEFQSDIPDYERLDIGFLGVTFAQIANLPSSPMMEDLIKVRDLCKGRYHGCAEREQVDRHLKQRVDSGLLDLPVAAGSS